ncbi:hypothetical protein RCH07_003669 [Arthrobacter sp. CG_A4]|nr:hypothetical protein [Arthrobacter sp. CG_A4]
MNPAAPKRAPAMASVSAPCPYGWHLDESYARFGVAIRRIAARRRTACRWGFPATAEDLLTAGAWRSPFLDLVSPSAQKSPRIKIYKG